MSPLRSRLVARWLVPVSVAAVLVGGGTAVGVFSAAAEPSLPPRSAAQLLVDLQTSRLGGLSGTVVQRADLGLPALAGLGAESASGLGALVAGTNTLRVWYAGPDQVRVAVQGTLGETDIIRDGADVWTWSSRADEARHLVLPEKAEGTDAARGGPQELAMTPQQAADRALAAIDPSTEVSVGRAATIAGRDAYELVLRPRDTTSLVGQIRIAIDAEQYVPLRFALFATGADSAAFEVAFTQVEFTRPDPEQFVFNPPPGTTVTEVTPDSHGDSHGKAHGEAHGKAHGDIPDDREAGSDEGPGWSTVGTGWATVLVAPAGSAPIDGADPDGAAGAAAGDSSGTGAEQLAEQLGALLPKVDGEWGSGRLLAGSLFSILFTDDGRVLAGAVTPERLYQVAAAQR